MKRRVSRTIQLILLSLLVNDITSIIGAILVRCFFMPPHSVTASCIVAPITNMLNVLGSFISPSSTSPGLGNCPLSREKEGDDSLTLEEGLSGIWLSSPGQSHVQATVYNGSHHSFPFLSIMLLLLFRGFIISRFWVYLCVYGVCKCVLEIKNCVFE